MSNVFTYQEGGNPGNGIFASFLAAYQAAYAVANPITGGLATIIIDGSRGPGNTPTPPPKQGVPGVAGDPVSGGCGLIDLSRIDLIAAPNRTSNGGTAVNFTWQSGTTVKSFRNIEGLCMMTTSTAPVLTFDDSSTELSRKWSMKGVVLGAIGGVGVQAAMFKLQTSDPNPSHVKSFELAVGPDFFAFNGPAGIPLFQVDGNQAEIDVFASGYSQFDSAVFAGSGYVEMTAYGSGVSFPLTMPTLTTPGAYGLFYKSQSKNIVPSSGPTTSRPAGVPVGFEHFDTTLGTPIWWNGTAWKSWVAGVWSNV